MDTKNVFYQIKDFDNDEILNAFGKLPALFFSEEGKDRLIETWEFAKRTKQTGNLIAVFNNLANRRGDVVVYDDFAKYSFFWQWFSSRVGNEPIDSPALSLDERVARWQEYRVMVGGVVYHGPLDNGEKEQTFSVQLEPTNSWSIHT